MVKRNDFTALYVEGVPCVTEIHKLRFTHINNAFLILWYFSRRILNRTWTSRQKNSALKEKTSGSNQTSSGNPSAQQTLKTTGTLVSFCIDRGLFTWFQRVNVSQEVISSSYCQLFFLLRDQGKQSKPDEKGETKSQCHSETDPRSVSQHAHERGAHQRAWQNWCVYRTTHCPIIFMCYLLFWVIFSLNVCVGLTDKKTQAVDRHGRLSVDSREPGVLARLSMQSQQVKAELYRSLQHMRLQRAQLQASLKQQRETSDNNKGLDQNEVGCWL